MAAETYNGKVCRHCGGTVRFVSNKNCIHRGRSDHYSESSIDKKRKSEREFYSRNRIKLIEKSKTNHENNKSYINAQKRAQRAKIRETDPGYFSRYCSAYYKSNKIKFRAYDRNRKAAILKRIPPWADLSKIDEIYRNLPDGYHVDHIVPLRGKNVSGLHVENNLQYLPAKINIQKGNRFED